MAKKGNVLQQLGSLIGLVLIIVVITALNPAFIEIPNLFNILRQVSINALIAFGMTFVILTGGIDLSVGSILALSSALVAGMMTSGMDPFLAMAVGLLIREGIIEYEPKYTAFVGELSLDGTIKPVNGILPIVSALKDMEIEKVIVPFENLKMDFPLIREE